MKPLKKIFNKFNGLYYPQEYLCLAKESFQPILHVYLLQGKRITRDITNEHLFTGYSPLIFVLFSPDPGQPALPASINIAFTQDSRQPNEILEKKDAIALLSLKLIRRQLAGHKELAYYEGVRGKHHFISGFHQFIISLENQLTNKKPGNVFLHSNLYKQVQVAYSVPRVISLISVCNGRLFNLFPTDLHGPVNDQYYVSSLRHEGKACQQVLASGRIVISTIHCNAYKMVYSLGKNHMREPSTREKFPFGDDNSPKFQFPLPQSALICRELELEESLDHGIHKLFLYKIVSQTSPGREAATLAHIHNVYATWLHNKGLSGNYLLR